MPFRNPVIGGGGSLVYPSIHSPDFNMATRTGWSIQKNGSAFFFGGQVSGVDFDINDIGEFIYSGTPALGNLISTDTTSAGTDAFGNAYLQGKTGYSQSAGKFFALNLNGSVQFLVANAAGGPYVSQGALTIDSVGNIQLNALTQDLILNGAGFSISLEATGIVVSAPVTLDSFHNILLDANWSNTGQTAQYRLSPSGAVEIKGGLTHTTGIASTGVNINSGSPLPAAYRPSSATYYRAGDSNRPGILINTTGVLEAFGNGTETLADLTGVYLPTS